MGWPSGWQLSAANAVLFLPFSLKVSLRRGAVLLNPPPGGGGSSVQYMFHCPVFFMSRYSCRVI